MIFQMNSDFDEDFDARLTKVEAAIDQHGAHLRAYLFKLTRNHHDAEELFDDLWMHALHRFEFENLTSLPLLRRKAYQLFVDAWRKKARSRVTTVEEVPEQPVFQSIHQEAGTPKEEEAMKVRFFSEYDAGLSNEQRDALWLHARYGYTFAEVGEIMQKPSSTVGDWITQARRAFSDAFNNPATLQKR